MTNSSGKSGQQATRIKNLMRDCTRGNKSQHTFAQILDHARMLNRLDVVLSSNLDPDLAAHCQVAEFRNRCLILVCSNAPIANRIHMLSEQLLDSLRETGKLGVERIEMRIAPLNRPRAEAAKQPTLSRAAKQALGRFASDSGDPEIQAIFEQIINRGNG